MFCPKCGNQIKGGSFCDHCGHSMQQNVEKIGRFSFSIRKLKIDKKIVLFLLFIVVLITGIFAYNWRTGELSERQIEKKLTVIWSILLNTDKEMINNYLTKDFIEKDDFSEGFTVDFFSTLNDDLKEQLENFEKNLIKESYRNKLQIGKLEWENVVEVLGEWSYVKKQYKIKRANFIIRHELVFHWIGLQDIISQIHSVTDIHNNDDFERYYKKFQYTQRPVGMHDHNHEF